ncbi:MAG: DEAD/DEAH box helicase family protein [Actinomycetota bacterium]|nr:DEAD/DEAH box helicase family protein [Actinomycetota bacterium]
MADTVIDNPIINQPYAVPDRHFRFDEDGITDHIVEGRRPSAYFVPIPASRKRSAQLQLATEWTRDRLKPNDLVNQLRSRVDIWRKRGRPGLTPTSRRLLDYWTDPSRERPLFFCQVEALETIMYLTECAAKQGDAWVANQLADANAESNSGLPRVAMKMATGSGKTVVMAMLIAWHTLNRQAERSAKGFSDAFLVVSPGITIRDRLRVLLPSDPGNYYRERDLVPAELTGDLQRAQVLITNFHAFGLRDTKDARGVSRTTKEVLGASFTETPDQMVRRVCREFGGKRNILVLNDEAHHCYRRKAEPDVEEALSGDERVEAKTREEEARVWISGLEAVRDKIGIRVVYDLSATPFFLRGSGYSEGTLFPWVVSDFSLIDAIESGIVKIPRVPVADDAMAGEAPTYRDLWSRIRDGLPRKGRGADSVDGPPRPPVELEGALHSLYDHYARSYHRWAADDMARGGATPPVFIEVCNNTNVSKLVFDYIAGWDKPQPDGTMRAQEGRLPLFRNEDDGRWLDRPRTILVDSRELESGGALSPEFKRIAAREIEEFKSDLRQRFPGRDADAVTDADLLREVMNTVGKPGRLGEGVRCVVSVSMLTEGWDANTVTHILGVRAFGTQLLCEQVVGRGLRRRSYVVGDDGLFTPEYAEVYGVPFSFIPTAGSTVDPMPGPTPTRVRALADRAHLEITFPRVTGYRMEIADERLYADFGDPADTGNPCTFLLTARDLPSTTEVTGIVGPGERHTLEALRAVREQQVIFALAREVLDRHLRDESGNERPWYFPQLVPIVRDWLRECVAYADGTFVGMLLLAEPSAQAVERIRRGLARVVGARSERLLPIVRPYDPVGSTAWVDFDTTKGTYLADPAKSPVSHVVLDGKGGNDWEAKVAAVLESLPAVESYVKNDHVGFTIPYVDTDGEQRSYAPDFLVRLAVAEGDEAATLVVEVSGGGHGAGTKAEKVAAARELWVPAVNAQGGFGRWGFVNVTDPWDCRAVLSPAIAALTG